MQTQGTTIVDVVLTALTMFTLALMGLAMLWRWLRQRWYGVHAAPHQGTHAHYATAFDNTTHESLRIGTALPPSSAASTLPPELRWLRRLLFALHALIIGQTRAGKTTITHFIATSRAKLGHRVIVCDPDAAPGMWPGCEVSGYEDDFAAIEQTLQALRPELTARRTARSRRTKARLTPLTLVLSEAGDIMNRCPTARDIFEQVLRRGGKLNISLLVDVQDRQRDTLNIPGATHLLKNFEEQVEVYREAGQRRVRYAGQAFPVPDLPNPEELADAYAQRHPTGGAQNRTVLADLLEEELHSGNGHATVPNASESQNGAPSQQTATDRTTERSENGHTPADDPAVDPTAVGSENDTDFPPATAEEIRKLGRALRHAAQGAGKHESIYVGWGLKRGGGPQYKRAEALFDLAVEDAKEESKR